MGVGNHLFAQSAEMGALPTLYAATAADLPGGVVRGARRIHGARGYPRVVTAPARRTTPGLAAAVGAVGAADRRHVRVPGGGRRVTAMPARGRARVGGELSRSGSASLPCSRRSSPATSARGCPQRARRARAVLRGPARPRRGTDARITHWQHPRYSPTSRSAPREPAILAELLAATLNSVAILWRTSPASTELEGVVLDWVAEAARACRLAGTATSRTPPRPRRWPRSSPRARPPVATSSSAPSTPTPRSTRRRGCSACACARSPVDADFRMRRRCDGRPARRRGRHATVGTTATTSVDPVRGDRRRVRARPGLAARRRRLRGRGDGLPEFRWAFAGVDRADSLVVNAHKWMLTPVDCSLLWTRRPHDFRPAFSVIPEFLRTPDAEDALSLSEYGPALGRRFRALKLWAVLRCHGRNGLQAHVRGGIGLAQKFEQWVAASRAGSCARRGTSRRLLPRRGRRPAKRRAAGAGQRQRRAVHLARRAGRALCVAAGDRADEHDRGGRAPGLGRAAPRGRRPVIAAEGVYRSSVEDLPRSGRRRSAPRRSKYRSSPLMLGHKHYRLLADPRRAC